MQNVLRSHKLYFSEVNVISDISNNSAFNNAKVTDHHAVIPTNIVPDNNILSKLSEKERNIYDLVITRFFQRFSPDCQKEKIVLTTNLEGISSHIAKLLKYIRVGRCTILKRMIKSCFLF